MIDRRRFVAGAVGTAAWTLAARAQRPTGVARIAYLLTGSPNAPEGRMLLDVFRQSLRDRGYVEGRNVVIDYRYADGRPDRLPALAVELVALKPDVVFVGTTLVALAVKQATATIPIVAFAMTDPAGDGLVASLARPGGNVTGLTFVGPELASKNLTLLKEAIPRLARVAALWQPGALGERTTQSMLNGTQAAARASGLDLSLIGIREVGEVERAFSTMTGDRIEAVLVLSSPLLFAERRRLVALVARHRLPSMYGAREYVELGGLMSYGASQADLLRRGCGYVDQILKGAKPADLPVQQPTKFELVINLKTANALGLAIAPSVLLRADERIE